MEPFLRLAAALARTGVRFVCIGVGGVNYYAQGAAAAFATLDRDLFLPLEPTNELLAWRACESVGFDLQCGDEPLDQPRDEHLSRR